MKKAKSSPPKRPDARHNRSTGPRTLYVLGNPLLPEDSLALHIAEKLAADLPRLTIIPFDPNEEMAERDPIFLDVAQGIKRPTIIKNLDRLQTSKTVSLHDYDAALSLKLLKKIGKINAPTIIAVPMDAQLTQVYNKVKSYVQRTFRK